MASCSVATTPAKVLSACWRISLPGRHSTFPCQVNSCLRPRWSSAEQRLKQRSEGNFLPCHFLWRLWLCPELQYCFQFRGLFCESNGFLLPQGCCSGNHSHGTTVAVAVNGRPWLPPRKRPGRPAGRPWSRAARGDVEAPTTQT